MVNLRSLVLRGLLAVALCAAAVACTAVSNEKKDYVVYLGKASGEVDSLAKEHARMIAGVVEESYASRALIRSYGRSFNGFVAKLTENEANVLAGQQGVVSVFPDRALQLHTTRSWDFLGLSVRSPRRTTVESDIIIGVIDTGIWPESESFNDEGFGPPPKKWKGACKGGANFTCNNKLIGARFYRDESARDYVGHGSHTASTAAGRFVQHASFFGLAEGIARGGVPSARIAVYRACSDRGCLPSDILSSFDDAIADGVDIITASLGSSYNITFDEDAVAIGSFHAMEKGILTTQSAGNGGSYWQITTSTAPWIFSVAASSIDRMLIDGIALENGITLTGRSINGFPTTDEYLPIIYGAEVGSISSTCDENSLKNCHYGCLDSEKVAGKIVLCDLNFAAQQEPPRAGAAGVIMPMIRDDVSSIYALPSSVLNGTNYNKVHSYHEQTRNPKGKLIKSKAIDDPSAPLIASFSSWGPNPYILDIMKPDVSAPGVDILAAFSSDGTPSSNLNDSRRVSYSFISGTSMSCPHVAGTAAYVKSFHPDWSPSAIKSAIMTTARPMQQNLSYEFSYGSGQVNPLKAVSPGLVYDMSVADYSKLLCTLDINVTRVVGHNFTCVDSPKLNARDMNYPSIVLSVNMSITPISFEVSRAVTNVGPGNSTYKATLSVHPKVNITVAPQVLHFNSTHQKATFSVSVTLPAAIRSQEVLSSSLVWSDGTHYVRSPIIVYNVSSAIFYST